VRAFSHGLAPVALEDDGLMHALHELAEATVRSTGVRCVFECPQPAAHREDLEVTRQSQARKESGQNVVEFLET